MTLTPDLEMGLTKVFGLLAIFVILFIFNFILLVERESYGQVISKNSSDKLQIVVVTNSTDWIVLQKQFYQVVAKGWPKNIRLNATL